MEKKYRRMLEAMRNDYRLEERSLQEHNRVCELDTGGGLPNGDSPNASLASAAALRLAGVDWACVWRTIAFPRHDYQSQDVEVDVWLEAANLIHGVVREEFEKGEIDPQAFEELEHFSEDLQASMESIHEGRAMAAAVASFVPKNIVCVSLQTSHCNLPPPPPPHLSHSPFFLISHTLPILSHLSHHPPFIHICINTGIDSSQGARPPPIHRAWPTRCRKAWPHRLRAHEARVAPFPYCAIFQPKTRRPSSPSRHILA